METINSKIKNGMDKLAKAKLIVDYARLVWIANFSKNPLQRLFAQYCVEHWDEFPDR